MKQHQLGDGLIVSEIGLGCMSMSGMYGTALGIGLVHTVQPARTRLSDGRD